MMRLDPRDGWVLLAIGLPCSAVSAGFLLWQIPCSTSYRSTLQYREQEMTASQVAGAEVQTKMLSGFPCRHVTNCITHHFAIAK